MWRLNGEDTLQMYSKHLSIYSILRHTAQYLIYTAILSIHRYIDYRHEIKIQTFKKYG